MNLRTPALHALIAATAFYALPSIAAAQAQHVKARPADVLAAPTNFYSFTDQDLGNPVGSIIQARDGNFYGVTSNDEVDGTIYQITPSGAKTTVFTLTDLSPKGALFSGPDGNLYGLAVNSANTGYVYGYNIARQQVFYTYELDGTAAEGFTQDASGNLYGLTTNGGTYGQGSLFVVAIAGSGSITSAKGGDYPPTVTVTTLQSFQASADPQPNDPGYSPLGTPLVGSDGNIYGYTIAGPYSNSGGLWIYYLSQVPATKALGYFNLSIEGSGPTGGLVQVGSSIYGMLNAGSGSILQFTPGTTAVNAVAHTGADRDFPFNNGVPLASSTEQLITAGGGGANGVGALNDVDVQDLGPEDGNVDLYDFTGGTADGSYPQGQPSAGILSNGHGVLIGADDTGGAHGFGEVYVFDEAGNDTPVITLTTSSTTLETGSPITLKWNVTNAYSVSAQTCFAFSSDYTFSGKLPSYSGSMQVTPETPGYKNYAVTCGGVESAVLNLPVTNGAITVTDGSGSAPSRPESFGTVPEGGMASQTYTIANNSAIAFPFSISVAGQTSSAFSHTTTCPAEIPSGNTCTVTFTYNAPATAQQDQATFTIAKNGFSFPNGNTALLDARSVAPGVITLSADEHNFGNVDQPVSYTYNVYNGTGSTQPFSNTATQVSGPAGTASSTTTCPSTLAVNESCSVTVSFSTTNAGSFQVNDTITTPATVKPAKTVKLYGNAE